MSVHVWLFSGYAGSGKTTAANILTSLFDPKTTFVTAFADAVKDDVAHMYNLPRSMFDTQEGKASIVKTPDGERTARELLIDYSLAMKEAHGEAVWAEEVVRRIKHVVERRDIQNIIIHDWRYLTEIETLQNEHTFILHTIRVCRSCVKSLPIPSEHNIDNYKTDITILNDGSIDDLKLQIARITNSHN